MPKLEEVLKARGYTDADLAGMATLLSDNRFRSSLEASFDEIDSNARKARDDEWNKIKETQWEATLAAREKEAREARIEAARLAEENKIAREWGFMDDPQAKAKLEAQQREQRDRQQQQQATGFNPDDPKFREFAGRFSTAEGDAMAMYHNIGQEYQHLTGQPIYEYTGSDGSRGMVALRKEWLAMGGPQRAGFDTFVGTKFDFAGKRAEQARKAQEAHDKKVADDAVAAWRIANPSVDMQNPMLQGPRLSNRPFVEAPKDGKQPWDRGTAQERASVRRQNAVQAEVKSRVQVN